MKILNVLFIMLLLPIVSAILINIQPGDNLVVTTIPICESDIEVKINGDDSVKLNDFLFEKCNPVDKNDWICNCDRGSPFPLVLHTTPNVSNTYDVTVQYYLKDKAYLENMSKQEDGYAVLTENTRTLNFNDIEVKQVPSVPSKKSKSDNSPDNVALGVIIVLVGIGLFIGLVIGGYFLIRNLLKDDDVKKPEPIKNAQVVLPKSVVDKQVEDLIKKL